MDPKRSPETRKPPTSDPLTPHASEPPADPFVMPMGGLSGVTLWPAGVPRGSVLVPDTPYKLVAYDGEKEGEAFMFVHQQEIVALVTHPEDASVGWEFARNGVALNDRAIAAEWGSVGFSVFHTLAGLMLLGDVRGREVMEEMWLNVTAVLRGEPARMRHGVTVLFHDFRCKDPICRFRNPPRVPQFDNVTLSILPWQTVVVHHDAPASK